MKADDVASRIGEIYDSIVDSKDALNDAKDALAEAKDENVWLRGEIKKLVEAAEDHTSTFMHGVYWKIRDVVSPVYPDGGGAHRRDTL